ncbi:MAG: YafY family transcriptional regulator [Balneolaceae bacterium]|nr:MAG: YafY family transcriptional regulator [Balneolaceae bacterium]
MLKLQQSKERITVDKLAREFGVSRRTIFRDFNALSEVQVPVTYDDLSGYGIMDGYSVPPLMFSQKELATILVGLNFVKSQVDKNLIDDAKGVELKIKNVLPDTLKAYMESLDNKTVVDPFLHFGHEKKVGGNWYTLSNAISENRTVTFKYKSQKDSSVSERQVDPYLLVFYRDHWNMIGFSHKRDAIRNFVLDRMENVSITSQKFEPRENNDTEALIFGSNESGQEVVVLVDDRADRAFRANLPTKIFKEEAQNNKKIKVQFRFENLGFLNEWLLQFGNKVQVLSPKELIEKREYLLKEMLNQQKG